MLLYTNELNSVSETADIAADMASGAATAGGDSIFLDAVTAGAIGMMQNLMGEESEELTLAAGRAEEAGTLLQVIVRGAVEVLEIIGRVFVSFL